MYITLYRYIYHIYMYTLVQRAVHLLHLLHGAILAFDDHTTYDIHNLTEVSFQLQDLFSNVQPLNISIVLPLVTNCLGKESYHE